MTVVTDQRMMVPVDWGFGDANPGLDESDEVVRRYLNRWVGTDGRSLLPSDDPCSLGLLTAMLAARPDAKGGGALDPTDLSMAPH
jgi:hypothetical protein